MQSGRPRWTRSKKRKGNSKWSCEAYTAANILKRSRSLSKMQLRELRCSWKSSSKQGSPIRGKDLSDCFRTRPSPSTKILPFTDGMLISVPQRHMRYSTKLGPGEQIPTSLFTWLGSWPTVRSMRRMEARDQAKVVVTNHMLSRQTRASTRIDASTMDFGLSKLFRSSIETKAGLSRRDS